MLIVNWGEFMKKLYLLISALVFMIFVFAFFFLTGSSTTPAYLDIDYGSVEVDQGSGWVKAEDQMELSLDDKIKTNDAKASVILFESVIISLDPDSEVSIADLSNEVVFMRI